MIQFGQKTDIFKPEKVQNNDDGISTCILHKGETIIMIV